MLGDPLQGIFDFGDGLVPWSDVIADFPLIGELTEPWRWKGKNERLGAWCLELRRALLAGESIDLRDAPISWRKLDQFSPRNEGFRVARLAGGVVVIHKWEAQAHDFARRLGGRYRSMEEVASKAFRSFAQDMDVLEGPARAARIVENRGVADHADQGQPQAIPCPATRMGERRCDRCRAALDRSRCQPSSSPGAAGGRRPGADRARSSLSSSRRGSAVRRVRSAPRQYACVRPCAGESWRSLDAFRAASGGSLCVRRRRLPDDFSTIVPRLRRAHDVQYIIVCANVEEDADPLLVLPAPIQVPPLASRMHELDRIVDEYAADAIVELQARDACFTPVDRRWILEHATSLTEIEKATVRVVALRMSRHLSEAAERLSMAPVSLWRWILRRKLPTFIPIN